jgi:hypothetical protein
MVAWIGSVLAARSATSSDFVHDPVCKFFLVFRGGEIDSKLKGWAKGKEPTERFMRKIGDVMETIGKSYILNPHKKLHKGQKKPNGQHSEVIKFTEVILDLSVIPDIFRKNRGRCKVKFLSKELNKEPAAIRALLEALAESGLLERVGEDEYRIVEADE